MTLEDLQELLATISCKDAAEINASTMLTRLLAGSLGRAKLDAALRSKWSITEPGIYKAATFGELCTILGVDGSGAETTSGSGALVAVVERSAAVSGDVQLGVDIESVAAMPEAADYWESDFYKGTFVPSEIAYAILQPSARESFAAMWCAKEALRKANPAFAHVAWRSIEVAHDSTGKPSLLVNGQSLGGALSVSHTSDYAVAIYSAVPPPAPSPVTEPVITQRPSIEASPVQQSSSKAATVAALFALIFSIIAILLALLFHR